MKHKVSELEGALLDAAVAKALGLEFGIDKEFDHAWTRGGPQSLHPWSIDEFAPSTDWSDGGPIIERERIDVIFWGRKAETRWRAAPLNAALIEIEDWGTSQDEAQSGPTPLIAAMRAYAGSKFGEEVELP